MISHTIPRFLKKNIFENILGKGDMLVNTIFSFSSNVFYPYQNKFRLEVGDEYPQQPLARKLLLITEHPSGVTRTNFIKGQQLCGNSINHDKNIICASSSYIKSVYEI